MYAHYPYFFGDQKLDGNWFNTNIPNDSDVLGRGLEYMTQSVLVCNILPFAPGQFILCMYEVGSQSFGVLFNCLGFTSLMR